MEKIGEDILAIILTLTALIFFSAVCYHVGFAIGQTSLAEELFEKCDRCNKNKECDL